MIRPCRWLSERRDRKEPLAAKGASRKHWPERSTEIGPQLREPKPRMPPETLESQQRFADLARRSFRAKISVLLLLLVSLFVVWSTLTTGTTAAEQVDKDFCLRIIKDPYYWPSGGFGEGFCTPFYSAQDMIRMARHLHDNDAPYPASMSLADVEKHLHEYADHIQQFQDYDWNRRQAYRIDLSLPYAKSPVSLNGVFISDAWPFCALLTFSVVLALGFRQTCYEIHLSALAADTKPREARGRDFALTEFVAGEISEATLGGRSVFLYKKPIGLFPENVASGALLMTVAVMSLNLLTDYSPQFTERGEELLSDSYYLLLYLFAVVLFLLLMRTRRLWRGSVEEAMGGEVKSARLFFLQKSLRLVHDTSIAGVRLEPALICILAVSGLGSLLLHWSPPYRGFVFLLWPTRVLDDEPLAARIIQAEMLLAVVFLLVSFFSRLPIHIRWGWFPALVRAVRSLGSRLVLAISGFVLFYAFVGIYGFVKDWYAWPAILGFNYEAFLNLQNLPTLEDADFSLGFTLFVVSCGILALLETCLEAEHKSRRNLGTR